MEKLRLKLTSAKVEVEVELGKNVTKIGKSPQQAGAELDQAQIKLDLKLGFT